MGPNTGGMGAYAPAPVVTPALMQTIVTTILQPTMAGMASEGSPYRGVLYAGIIITENGPAVIEYNCRFGDPETQAVLPLVEGDLAELMLACTHGTLANVPMRVSRQSALCVVIASGGYPGHYENGKVIHGLDDANQVTGVQVFHAGTQKKGDDIVTAGGRVLGVTGIGADFSEARDRAYEAAGRISFEGSFNRTDIGAKALKHITT
jgi:phosphoribosylamine--glycine ligase